MEKIFEKATKGKIRFDYKGSISTEELWDLGLEELDSIFKKLSTEKRQISEESLLKVKTVENTLLNTKIEIIKHIVEYKLKEKQNKLDLKVKSEKKEKIMSILANKQDSELEGKTSEELQEMLNSL